MKPFVVGEKVIYKGQEATVRRTSVLGMTKTNSVQIVIDSTGEIITLLHDGCEHCHHIGEEHEHQ